MSSSASQSLRVMAYNILYGGLSPGPDRFDLIVRLVNQVQPDILALCECWGFLDDGGARRDAFCAAVGMAGEFADVQGGNPVGLLYRPPWKPSLTSSVTSPMQHGLVRMLLNDGLGNEIMALATHLNPYSGLQRLIESQVAFSRTRPGEHTILMGDFNALPLGFEGKVEARRLLDEQFRPDTAVSRYFAAAGFVDLLERHRESSPTFPTALDPRPGEFPQGVRLDYILAAESLARRCTNAWVIDGPEAQAASDHLPVAADFDMGT